MYEMILYDVKEQIATITLNRPEVGNAFAKESYIEIRQAFNQASQDEDVRVVVLTGKGKHFSAGGDIKRFQRLIDSGEYLKLENVMLAANMSQSIKTCEKPVIAMINGAAAGAGCSLALACDFRIVTKKSKLIMSFIKMGLSGDTGGLYYLQRLVGVAKAGELMMTGDPLTGEEAYRLGLATVLAEDEQLEEAAYEYAKKLAQSSIATIARQKKLMYETFYSDIADYSKREAEYMVESSHSPDFAEAVAAFLGKRKPNFSAK